MSSICRSCLQIGGSRSCNTCLSALHHPRDDSAAQTLHRPGRRGRCSERPVCLGQVDESFDSLPAMQWFGLQTPSERCVAQRNKARDQTEDEMEAGDDDGRRLCPLDAHKQGPETDDFVFSELRLCFEKSFESLTPFWGFWLVQFIFLIVAPPATSRASWFVSLCFEWCWKLNTVRPKELRTFIQNVEK